MKLDAVTRSLWFVMRGVRTVARWFSRSPNHAPRTTLCAVALPVMLLALGEYPAWLESFLRYVYMLLGFSVIIFVHELGHFLVARACKVKCPVFSIGMGHRLCGWRKGVGLTFGPESDVIDTTDHDAHEENVQAAIGDDIQQVAEPAGVTFREKTNRLDETLANLGQTDYRISMLPIGGYVRMLGQDDMDPTKTSPDPNSYNNKPIWQRMCIISAGVIMNVIFAVIIFAIVFKVGIDRPGPVVGRVQYGSPAERAGLHLGDRIVAAKTEGDNEHLDFMDIMIASALSNGREPVHYRWRPYGSDTIKEAYITPELNENTGLLMIGVSPIPALKLPALTAEEHAELVKAAPDFAEARSSDRIMAVNGRPLSDTDEHYGYVDLYQALQASEGTPITLTLHSDDPKAAAPDRTIRITPKLMPRDGTEGAFDLSIAGFVPRTKVDYTVTGMPADKELKADDVIARINEIENPTIRLTKAVINASRGDKINLLIDRPGAGTAALPVALIPKRTSDGLQVGVHLLWDTGRPIIAAVNPDNPALQNVIPGSEITAIDGHPMENWNQILAYIRQVLQRAPAANSAAPGAVAASAPTQPLPTLIFTLKLPVPAVSAAAAPASATVELPVPLRPSDRDDVCDKLEYSLGIPLEIRTEPQKSDSVVGAIAMGLDNTRKFIIQTYMTLRGLIITQTVSPTQLHGALGIAKVGHDIQEKGFIHLLFLLGVISVNLAVANFLPLPIVDGGHFLLLIVEKIRGRRLAPKIELTIQYVGLCLIIGMLLFVTYNDLSLFVGKR